MLGFGDLFGVVCVVFKWELKLVCLIIVLVFNLICVVVLLVVFFFFVRLIFEFFKVNMIWML